MHSLYARRAMALSSLVLALALLRLGLLALFRVMPQSLVIICGTIAFIVGVVMLAQWRIDWTKFLRRVAGVAIAIVAVVLISGLLAYLATLVPLH